MPTGRPLAEPVRVTTIVLGGVHAAVGTETLVRPYTLQGYVITTLPLPPFPFTELLFPLTPPPPPGLKPSFPFSLLPPPAPPTPLIPLPPNPPAPGEFPQLLLQS